MCGSMADIQSPTAEIRWGKKKRKEEEQTTGWKYIWRALLHRATIKNCVLSYITPLSPLMAVTDQPTANASQTTTTDALTHQSVLQKYTSLTRQLHSHFRPYVRTGNSSPPLRTRHSIATYVIRSMIFATALSTSTPRQHDVPFTCTTNNCVGLTLPMMSWKWSVWHSTSQS